VSGYDAIAGNAHEAQKGLTNRFAGGKITTATAIEASATLHTPAAGEQLTLYWIALSSSQENPGEVLATVKLGGKTIYEWYLGNPGAFMHWEPETGEVGDALTVELSGAQKVAVSYTYSESVP